jgi:hypothetical protein
MPLTPEQKAAVTSWVEAGDNLSAVQKKLAEQFKVNLTYRDVRFLVDDLELALKDPAPKVDVTDVSKAAPVAAPARPAPVAPEKKGFLDKAKEKLGLGAKDEAHDLPGDDEGSLDDEPGELPPAGGSVTVEIDKVTLMPGALASGSVTFSDGVTAKWMIDQMGRPGFTQVSQPGYRPSPEDGQAFMMELSTQLQRRGY